MGILIFGFTGNVLRILELNESKIISVCEEITLKADIGEDSYLKKNLKEFTDDVSEKLKAVFGNSLTERTAGIIIDTSQAFLTVIPLDFREDANSINSHILWELSNFFPDSYKDFNIKYYRLGNKLSDNNVCEVLLIAINKNKTELLKNVCNSCGIKIKNLELDQFAVEKCLKENYKAEISENTVVLIGCRNARLDFSLIVNGELKYYDYQIMEKPDFRNYLMRQLDFFEYEFNQYKPKKFFLYGEDLVTNIKEFLTEKISDTESIIINLSSKEQHNLSKFAPLFGLALKNFSLE